MDSVEAPAFKYDFAIMSVYSIKALRRRSWHRVGRKAEVDVPARELFYRRNTAFNLLEWCDARWKVYRRSLDDADGGQAVTVAPDIPGIADTDLLFECDTRWSDYLGAIKWNL